MGHHPAADPAATAGRATIQQAIGAVLTRLPVYLRTLGYPRG